MTIIRYVDFNRGSDGNSGNSPDAPWKTLASIYNLNPGAGGGVYLASDSVWDVAPTRAASNISLQTQFNGVAGNPAFITSYDPAGTSGSKPTIRYRMVPTPADWTWDSTVSFGYPRGWYIQLDWTFASWDVLVRVNGEFVGTTNQDTTASAGHGYINGTQTGPHAGGWQNGQTRETLRFNADYGGGSVGGSTNSRLYLSGLGLLSSGAGNDPSSVFGPGAIVIGFREFFSFYNSLSHVSISNIRCENGGGLLLMQANPDLVIPGLSVTNCEFNTTSTPLRFNSGSGSVSATKWTIDVSGNTASNLSGPAVLMYGIGIAGSYRNNTATNGNLSSSMGGGVYVQLKPSTYGGVRDPFVVSGNTMDTWKNGAGNNTFDGCCYYADIQDEGTIFRGNIAKNSYAALQCGSGSRSDWYANIALNCQKLGKFNNALAIQAQDYTISNNLLIASAPGSFTYGVDADTHPYALTIYQSGTASNLVGGRITNNVMINHPSDPNRIAINAYDATQWASGKLTIANNTAIGFNARQVVSDFNVTDRTSSAAMLNVTQAQCAFINAASSDYRIGEGSALWRAGIDIPRAGATDAAGLNYFSPPSVGPYEVRRMPDYFGLRSSLL